MSTAEHQCQSHLLPSGLVTIRELSRISNVSVQTIRRYVDRGVIEAFQPGGPGCLLLFRPNALEVLAPQARCASDAASKSQHLAKDQLPGRKPAWISRSPPTNNSDQED
jgi:hypothetical protein